MENNNEFQDSQTPEPEESLEALVEDTSSQSAEEALKEQNRRLFERAKKAELKVKELAQLPKKDVASSDDKFREVEERVELRMQGYKPEVISEIAAYARAKGISLPEAAKSPFVSAAVSKMREEEKSSEATPTPSNKVRTYNGKPINDIFRDETVSADEKQKAWEMRLKGGGANQAE